MHREVSLDDIFKKGSKTYYNSTSFFDVQTKKDVTILYSFVRVVDDYIDAVPQNTEAFYNMRTLYNDGIKKGVSGDVIIHTFVDLIKRADLDPLWVDAFFDSMEMDIHKKRYKNISEVEQYMYGSAEVVGLMMAKILKLPKKSYAYARDLGKAMQYINFIRDIGEDVVRGRVYFPDSDLKEHGMKSLEFKDASQGDFDGFVRKQLARYVSWQESAEKGYAYIPKKFLVPIKTASDMYNWTAKQIEKNPSLVYQKKLKPSRARIYTAGFANFLLSS